MGFAIKKKLFEKSNCLIVIVTREIILLFSI